MNERRYYSHRTGRNPKAVTLDLGMLTRSLLNVYTKFIRDGWFQEAFGYYCVDAGPGQVAGTLGPDVEAEVFLRLRKADLWPLQERYASYSEDDAFDVIEFLHDFVSKPVAGFEHDWNNCGWHYQEFDRDSGRAEFRDRINKLLHDYADGYELTEDGEILALGTEYLRPLLEQELPGYDPENVNPRVEAAVRKFRHHTPSVEDKQEAVRQLADVLEFLRKKLEGVLPSKEEDELFIIANKFGIRHHRADQKTEYDKEIWLDWIFYCYLNTIHVSVNLLKRAGESSQ